MIEPPLRRPPNHPPEERSGTIIETDEDVRQALLSSLKGQAPGAPVGPPPSAPAPAETARANGRAAIPFRPTARPAVPFLTVFDDGKMDGEVIRIRDQRFFIGRTEGDLRFPLDGRMSARHVEITHQVVGGLHRWVITDLQSAHGLFVRVSRTALADKAEFLVGTGRYQFSTNQVEGQATVDQGPSEFDTGQTQGWTDGTTSFRPPALTELLGREIGNRILLVKNEYWIGSDPACPVCRPDDPFCDPKHARIYRGSKGSWHAEHNKTQNGLWLRMPQITLESAVQFQIGEQRFKLKVQ